MTSMLKGEMGPTTHAVERSHYTTAATNAVNIDSAQYHIRRMGARLETCSAAPCVGDVRDPTELIHSFKSLRVDGTKETATPEPSPDEGSSEDSDSDWYTSDNDEGQTKAYPPFSKFGGYSFTYDPSKVDWSIIDRRYLSMPGPDGVLWWFCWGIDPCSQNITYLYRVQCTHEIIFYLHRTFNHFDMNDGPCPSELGYHFFQPTRTIYRQNDCGSGYESMQLYDERAFNTRLSVCHQPNGQEYRSGTFPSQWIIREPTGQQLTHDQRLESCAPSHSSQGTSLQSSPYSLDGSDFSFMSGSGTSQSSHGVPPQSHAQEIPNNPRGPGFSHRVSNVPESPPFVDPLGTQFDRSLHGFSETMSTAEGAVATLGASGSITGHASLTPTPPSGVMWPGDGDQVIRIAGLETEDSVDIYLGNFVKTLKEKRITEVYCWDCRYGERGRSIEQCKQNCVKLSSLKRHAMAHLKIKSFSCKVRGCTFNTPHKDNLPRHEKEHHAGNRRSAKAQTPKGNRPNPQRPARAETLRPSR